jgi:tetratricopeptide (TPR) repeat protein
MAGMGAALSLSTIKMGHHRLAAELHERLQGKISDPALERSSSGDLGTAYFRMGHYQRVIARYEEALRLARDQNDRSGEGNLLGNLGNCYGNLGQTGQAIDYQQKSLAVAREVGDRNGEASQLINLGSITLISARPSGPLNATSRH